MTSFINPNIIRANFSAAMSAMYSEEVPAYGQLLKIVAETNDAVLQGAGDNPPLEHSERISQERHGAIRLGTAEELAMMARIFSVMGMYPVGYYDLSIASIPVHSTAFRPIEMPDLEQNPFRIFTSLLRLELIEDEALRQKAKAILEKRHIFSDEAIALTEKAEHQGGLDEDDAKRFVAESLETFRWHEEACVDIQSFDALIESHRLTADIVSFKGPHINHLTPRTLDIDRGQAEMIRQGLPAKAVIEGPPKRDCPILLRQTAFKALEEPVKFLSGEQGWVEGRHTARFGEIEQRGVALTPKGRALYDRLLLEARAKVTPDPAGNNAKDYEAALSESFEAFPDDWRALYDEALAYFRVSIGPNRNEAKAGDVSAMLDSGVLALNPIIYEDFLPVSAAGIFQSNLGDDARDKKQTSSRQSSFEAAMGRNVINEFELYAAIQEKSLAATLLKMNIVKSVG